MATSEPATATAYSPYEAPLLAPQLVASSRMLHFAWTPADPAAAAALLPDRLAPAGAVFVNQYVVDEAKQTSGFGAYSLTYLGLELAGLFAPDGTPARFWTHYFNSSERMRAYAAERGVPASPGGTTFEVDGERLVATSFSDGVAVIRTVARAGSGVGAHAAGHLRYVTRVGERLVAGRYAYTADTVEPFAVESLEFLEPEHPVYALRPAAPLGIVWGFYSPSAAFCYPGGEEEI